MGELHAVREGEVFVSNEEFLKTLFADEWENAHVTAFLDDPSNIHESRRGMCWGGGLAGDRLEHYNSKMNQFFTISLFHPDEGRPVRRKAKFDACFVIVADDVNEKLPIDRVEQLPTPTYKLFTSAGSEQWGWVLSEPCEDVDKVNNLLDGLVDQGLAPDGTDPGMKGVTRYVRMPEGSNTKAKRLISGQPFKCYISEWNPELHYSIESLAAVFGIDLNRERNEIVGTGLLANSPIVANHPIMKHLRVTEIGNDGWLRVDCPNAAQHTGDDPSGAAVQVQPDGRVHFQCHHGHCQGEHGGKKLTGPRVVRLLDEQLESGSGQLLDEYDDYIQQIFIEGREKLSEVVKANIGIGSGSSVKKSEGSTEEAETRFDKLRYVYLAPENKFYDTKSGFLVTPKGLDNRYMQELPPGRNRMTASQLMFTSMDAALSDADGIGWNPGGLTAPDREHLIFEDEGKRMVNTWSGFALTPMGGDVSIWLDHAEYLIPCEQEREVVLNYLAAMVQRVDQKPGFFIGHRGAHRIGKDLFYKALVMAIGAKGARAVNIDNVLDGWGDYLFQLKFAIITEVDKAQDHKVANAMKTVVAPTASGKQVLNLKGKGVVTQLDCMGGVMMSNKRAFMAIEEGDKRYFVVDSWIEPKEASYYRALDDWYLKENGPAKVLNYLLNRDISEFDHNILPYMTKGALEMVKSGRYDYEQDLEDMINEGSPPFHMDAVTTKELKVARKEHGLKAGNNGIDEAMERLGWAKVRGSKFFEGKTHNTPTYFGRGLSRETSTTEAYEFYETARKPTL